MIIYQVKREETRMNNVTQEDWEEISYAILGEVSDVVTITQDDMQVLIETFSNNENIPNMIQELLDKSPNGQIELADEA